MRCVWLQSVGLLLYGNCSCRSLALLVS